MDSIVLPLPGELSVFSAAALVATSGLTSAITATFGLGGGVLLLGALLGVMPPAMAIPVHGVLQLGANAARSWFMRHDVLRAECLWFLPGALLGVVLASRVVVDLPTRWLSLALAAFLLWTVWAPGPSLRRLAPPGFALVGALTSFATVFIGATGPLVAAFLPPERLGRRATVATHGACMAVQHLLKVIAFALLGFSLADWLPLVLAMLASGFLGAWTGKHWLERLPERVFRVGFRVLLTAVALKLIADALGGGPPGS